MAQTSDLYQRKFRDSVEQLSIPIAADTRVFQCCIVCVNGGYAVDGTDTADLIMAGVATEPGDNTGGAAGDKRVKVRRGKRETLKCVGADQTWLLKPVYVVDNETVALSTTNSVLAGKVASVNSTTEVEVYMEV